ncbi:SurA N-terminal domain-containing protein [Hansschlegelia sp. KR7-227]|uniref:SurA N-terminal domain-containing protein n=1 Tax=Hansschlegelia sp. KR7-227 TaxID=3400914 RepID=UPI003BFA86AE
MLQALRSGAAGWIAKGFLVVLVASFAVWGIEDIFRIRATGENAAVVGDRKITVEEFRNAYTNELRRISEQAKRVITPEQARMAGIGERVLGNMVNEAAIDASVAKLRLSLSDEEVAREIQNDEIFRGPTGSFDRVTFNEILRQNNLNENEYIRLQRAFSARRQLTDALSANVDTPDAMLKALHAYNSDSRSIAYIDLKPEAPAAAPAPTDEALRAFYEDRKGSFNAPEYRKIAILSLDPKTLAATKTISDQELRAYYDANSPKYAETEKRSIEQISFPSFEEAKAASDQIKSGGALFEQIMIQRKLKPEDVQLGDLTKAQMFDAKIADAAFALKQGEVSDAIQGAYAPVILRVTGVQQQRVKSFEAVKGEIRAVLAEESARKDVLALHDKIDEQRLGGATLEEIAKAQNAPLRIVEAIDEAGKDPNGEPVADLPQADRLLPEAFRATLGGDTEAINAGDAYVWYDVRGVTPPRERPFDEVRAVVEQRWREEEARKRLDARADAVMAELKAGKTLEQVAAAQKLAVEQAETTRMGGAPSITAAQANAVFQAPVEGFGTTPADEQGARLVFRVVAENVRPYDPNTPGDMGQSEKIAQGLGADIVSAYVRKLRDDLGTEFDPTAIAKVTGGGSS